MTQERNNHSEQEQDNEIAWQREIIEKLLLEKKANKSRKWLWTSLLVLGLIFIFFMPLFSISTDKSLYSKHIATLKLSEEISEYNESLDKLSTGLKNIYINHNNVIAIIVEANSPGGSPVISDIAYQEIKYYRNKYPDIPIYTVVSDMCASGCYYIASATDKIYANPSSVVGSIGVIMPGVDLTSLANKLGVKDRTKTAGKNKALGNPFQPETLEQVTILNTTLDEIHAEFINSVKQGRGTRLKWQENSDIFTGRIYSGIAGKKVGLIDDFGSIYSISRNIMKNPTLVDYTPEDDWIKYMRKTIGTSLKTSILDTIKSTISNSIK